MAASWSFKWNLTPPQQPAKGSTTVCMPQASSTRAVALLMLGLMAGCTQPASNSTLRSCVCVGKFPLLRASGTLALMPPGKRPRSIWPVFMAGANSAEFKPSFSAQRTACSVAGRGTFSSTSLRPISTRWPYCTPLGHVVSQLRHVKQRSKCSCVSRVGATPSSTCLIR